ncbi:MAG: TIGR03792 family protein [Microcoleaceae cyanobacterium]
MVIEWLEFRIPPDKQEAFIQRDEEVWTQGLKQLQGFIGKEVWTDPNRERVILVIRWETREAWKSVPARTIRALDRQMGELRYPITHSLEYRVRKFLH